MDPDLFSELNIPRSTALDWIRKDPRKFVTHDIFDFDHHELIQEVRFLKKQWEFSRARTDLITKATNISGFQIQYIRIPHSAQKVCRLEGTSSCPKVTPQQLTPFEIAKIKFYATSDEFAHFPVTSLSWFAKKSGDLYASAATWSKVIKEYGLRRPGKRIYPAKPKIGIRATNSRQIWHLDVSVIKLLDGTRCFIQAVMDNYSRYVLAWQVSKDYGGLRSAELLRRAIKKSHDLGLNMVPEVWMDSGSENVNRNIDELIDKNFIRRILAQIEVDQSNSMIEALFLRTKHRYLFKKKLDSFENLSCFVDFYMNDSNDLIPHGALKGATPLEVITSRWDPIIIQQASLTARAERLSRNRALNCGACPT